MVVGKRFDSKGLIPVKPLPGGGMGLCGRGDHSVKLPPTPLFLTKSAESIDSKKVSKSGAANECATD